MCTFINIINTLVLISDLWESRNQEALHFISLSHLSLSFPLLRECNATPASMLSEGSYFKEVEAA